MYIYDYKILMLIYGKYALIYMLKVNLKNKISIEKNLKVSVNLLKIIQGNIFLSLKS